MRRAVVVVLLLLVPLAAAAQFRMRRAGGDAVTVDYDSHYVFTRVRYNRGSFGGGFRWGGDAWAHDYPTADRNLGAILDYITNMRVRTDGTNILDLDDPRIFENPILYMSEPGFWGSNEVEAKNLRQYLLKGGLIIFDDFEGPDHWSNLEAQMRLALPEHHWIPITVEHPVFQSFFALKVIDVPHPSVRVLPRYMALFEKNDPNGRMLALANHNNDLGEYWEWSAEGLYSEDPTNSAYRLGVNYIVYGMTH